MDVGTAKPTPEERAAAPHHLIDVVEPDAPFSLGQWLDLAQAALADVWSRGKQPLLVGGTGQYVWALLEGWRVPRVPPQAEFRRRLEERATREGPEALYEKLKATDPVAAAKIDRRNLRRVIRALEVLEATGKPLSYWQTKEPPPFETLVIGLRLPRDELYRRIDGRVARMVEDGLGDEVRRLLAAGYSRDLPSMSGIGYKEMCQHVAGELDLATAVARIKTETRRLSRHQNSWSKRGDPRVRWIEATKAAAEEAARLLESELGLRTNSAEAAARGR
ncbi:MAG: tRNA (adenosine(37)-N6)-dimethylallyltransferase MiaA [Chloroflexi bacterium]|nr:tRNA (adenosine(37)-N6)-dimethylallyltransferase MiaA [Chloroflexota bacterium]